MERVWSICQTRSEEEEEEEGQNKQLFVVLVSSEMKLKPGQQSVKC